MSWASHSQRTGTVAGIAVELACPGVPSEVAVSVVRLDPRDARTGAMLPESSFFHEVLCVPSCQAGLFENGLHMPASSGLGDRDRVQDALGRLRGGLERGSLAVRALYDAAHALGEDGIADWCGVLLGEELGDRKPAPPTPCWTHRAGDSWPPPLPPPAWLPRSSRVAVSFPAAASGGGSSGEGLPAGAADVLFSAAWSDGELALCSFTLSHGEVAMFHSRAAPEDGPAACSQLLDTMRALAGGAACLVAAPANAHALSHALAALESAAGLLQARWAPSFLVVSANEVEWGPPCNQRVVQRDLCQRVAAAAAQSLASPSYCSGLLQAVCCAVATARSVHCALRAVCAKAVSMKGPTPHSHGHHVAQLQIAIRSPWKPAV
eukprot:m51a1_g12150 hypothetical protein (379) ;mRNA; r:489-1959